MFHSSVLTLVAVNFGVWTQNTFDAIAPYSSKPDSFPDHHPQQHSHQFKLSNLPRVFHRLFLPELFYGHVVLCPLLMVPVHVLHQSSKDCTFFIAYIALKFIENLKTLLPSLQSPWVFLTVLAHSVTSHHLPHCYLQISMLFFFKSKSCQ